MSVTETKYLKPHVSTGVLFIFLLNFAPNSCLWYLFNLSNFNLDKENITILNKTYYKKQSSV